MRRILVLPLLAIALASFTKAQGTISSKTEAIDDKEVMKIENEQNRALLKGDTAVLERLWPDDFAYTNANGQLLSKAQIIEGLRSGNRKYYTINHDHIEVHNFGNTIVLRGRSTSKVLSNGKISEGPRTFVDIFAKHDGTWRSVAHAANPRVKQ